MNTTIKLKMSSPEKKEVRLEAITWAEYTSVDSEESGEFLKWFPKGKRMVSGSIASEEYLPTGVLITGSLIVEQFNGVIHKYPMNFIIAQSNNGLSTGDWNPTKGYSFVSNIPIVEGDTYIEIKPLRKWPLIPVPITDPFFMDTHLYKDK